MTPKKTLAGLGATAILMGSVDASVLAETPLERVETIANERVEARQIGNIVETSLPWKGETGLKVKYDMGEPTIAEKMADKRKQEVITETVDFGDGGFKVDILLNEKPDTNVFCYQIEGAENYDFFYQPPLTAEEIAEGSSRPENIEGSYAVYHKTLKNHQLGKENYATGKVMHIPRPQVWELDNEESTKEWADLSYTETEGLCVTARQEFLDRATYPVRVDPTFGYTSIGATSVSATVYCSATSDTSQRFGQGFTNTADGTLNSLHIYTKLSVAGPDLIDFTAFLNLENTATDSHSQVATVERLDVSMSSTPGWQDFTASSETISPNNYVINAVCDGNDVDSGYVNGYRDNTANINQYIEAKTGASSYTNAKESPWTNAETVTTATYSIYATYTAAGGGGATSTDSGAIWFE